MKTMQTEERVDGTGLQKPTEPGSESRLSDAVRKRIESDQRQETRLADKEK
jgi:hypothetical protein